MPRGFDDRLAKTRRSGLSENRVLPTKPDDVTRLVLVDFGWLSCIDDCPLYVESVLSILRGWDQKVIRPISLDVPTSLRQRSNPLSKKEIAKVL